MTSQTAIFVSEWESIGRTRADAVRIQCILVGTVSADEFGGNAEHDTRHNEIDVAAILSETEHEIIVDGGGEIQ